MNPPAIQVDGLTLRFGGVLALSGLNLTVDDRELRCLVGPNGAGKSTLFKCLTGQYAVRPHQGRIRLFGRDVTGWSPSQIARLGVGIKTQVPSVMNGLTVAENLWLACRRVTAHSQVSGALQPLIEELCLQPLLRAPLAQLSHGQRQVAEIAMVLAQAPRLVLLDEPAAGLAPGEMNELLQLIRHVHARATVVVVDHDMHFVRELGGQVTVLNYGVVLTQGDAATVLSDPLVREVYLGQKLTTR